MLPAGPMSLMGPSATHGIARTSPLEDRLGNLERKYESLRSDIDQIRKFNSGSQQYLMQMFQGSNA